MPSIESDLLRIAGAFAQTLSSTPDTHARPPDAHLPAAPAEVVQEAPPGCQPYQEPVQLEGLPPDTPACFDRSLRLLYTPTLYTPTPDGWKVTVTTNLKTYCAGSGNPDLCERLVTNANTVARPPALVDPATVSPDGKTMISEDSIPDGRIITVYPVDGNPNAIRVDMQPVEASPQKPEPPQPPIEKNPEGESGWFLKVLLGGSMVGAAAMLRKPVVKVTRLLWRLPQAIQSAMEVPGFNGRRAMGPIILKKGRVKKLWERPGYRGQKPGYESDEPPDMNVRTDGTYIVRHEIFRMRAKLFRLHRTS